ncbi:MAG TPA: YggT family protein [Alphaproteobacteria bacterium]|nr:YggT family protein [Alphaproteobacteria bacterium]HNS43736.1 YggT family protein [Alphaproteobacteria bacterium]
MFVVAQTISTLIGLYMFVIILQVAVSWLIVFKVLNTDNPQAKNLVNLLKRATDPVMVPVQKYVPPIGGIDITPIIVIIGLQILDTLVWRLLSF